MIRQQLDMQVMVRLRSDQLAQLREMAKAEDRSVAYIVRKAVDLYLGRQP